jgi:hypothetical protein
MILNLDKDTSIATNAFYGIGFKDCMISILFEKPVFLQRTIH